VLQEKEFEALGSNDVVRADVRIIAATSRKLPELVKSGAFRADLYYRLDVLSIAVPPLRERIEDMELICETILEGFAEARAGGPYELQPDALAVLSRYHWPGNIRELRNVLERAILLTDSAVLTAAGVQAALAASSSSTTARARGAEPLPAAAPAVPPEGHAVAMSHYERGLIERALAETPSVAAAAKRLGIGRATLYRKMAAYRIGRWEHPPAPRDEAPHGADDGPI
jgi:transcriptional regulator with PAS, ATPase and Fis domain